jgi:hypothetical protein
VTPWPAHQSVASARYIAPTAYHRMMFRARDKQRLVLGIVRRLSAERSRDT